MATDKKKSFAADLNPAMAILQQAEPAPEDHDEKAPRRLTLKKKGETYSQRIQLLVRPSVLKILREDAEAEEVSLNAYINALFDEYIKQRNGD